MEALGAKETTIKVDPKVVLNQVLGEYTTKVEKLNKYLQLVLVMKDHFRTSTLENNKTGKLDSG